MFLVVVISPSTLAVASFGAWRTSILVGEHGLAFKDTGAAMALGTGPFGGVGVPLSGRIATRLRRAAHACC
jgi:hypothetical protein